MVVVEAVVVATSTVLTKEKIIALGGLLLNQNEASIAGDLRLAGGLSCLFESQLPTPTSAPLSAP